MVERDIVIEPRDPAIFRDGKAFDSGSSARSVNWPFPSAVIGPIRSRLGRNTEYDPDTVDRLLAVEHVGPFLVIPAATGDAWEPCFAPAADGVAYAAGGDDIELRRLAPGYWSHGEGADLPDGIQPLFMATHTSMKPMDRPPAFWTADFTRRWLARVGGDCQLVKRADVGIAELPRSRRIHISIDSATQTAADEMLFVTDGLEFQHGTERRAIVSHIRYEDALDAYFPSIEAVAPLGGERRLAYWSEPKVLWPTPPAGLSGFRRVRLQLVTPGAFDAGWKPGWAASGWVPGVAGLKLTLKAAAVPRAAAQSGWDFRDGAQNPRATRLLAAAGSVYFFEAEGDVSALWLSSICDREEDRRNGLGIVLCGDW